MTNYPETLNSQKKDNTRKYITDVSICNSEIPLWEVWDVYGFNKIIGHAKYINRNYGKVLFRGQTNIYSSFRPSAYRRSSKLQSGSYRSLSKAQIDKILQKNISILQNDKGNGNNKKSTIVTFINSKEHEVLEAILQHYCYKTRFIDVVDNQWIALWFASHRKIEDNKLHLIQGSSKTDYECDYYTYSNEEYSYVYLLAVPDEKGLLKKRGGVENGRRHCLVDIRRACPSVILRPHMQHGLVVGYYDKCSKFKVDYAEQLIAIIRIKTEKCIEWLKGDKTLTAEALFPNPGYDKMYEMILETRKDLFDSLENPTGLEA